MNTSLSGPFFFFDRINFSLFLSFILIFAFFLIFPIFLTVANLFFSNDPIFVSIESIFFLKIFILSMIMRFLLAFEVSFH